MHFVTPKGILSNKNGMNIYRGCMHGCIYCDSRSLCYNMNHDFEDIEVKENATELLEKALCKKRRKVMIGTGSMTDPYIPQEAELGNMRKILQLIYNHGFGFTVITKSDLIVRDIDLLKKINERAKCVVQMTLTTCDEKLCRLVEPGVATTKRRFEILKTLRNEGIPTVVWLSPILPFINDTEENINGIIDYCERAQVYGVICFGMGVTLREGNREYFFNQLDCKFPGMKEKYMKTFGNRYVAESLHNRRLMEIFRERCRQSGIICDNEKIFEYLRAFPEQQDGEQMSLFL